MQESAESPVRNQNLARGDPLQYALQTGSFSTIILS